MEPDSYDTDTSGMARVHAVVEDALEDAIGYVNDASDSSRVAAVASFCGNLLEYVHVHHGAEDELVYPRLEQRGADALDSIVRVWSGHRLLQAPMTRVGEAIDQWRTGVADDSAAALSGALSTFLDLLTSHCRDEEEVILPLASRYLSQSEWEEMLPYERQNYRADKPWLVLGLTLESCDEDQRRALLARLPEARRTTWTEEWSAAFEAFMTQVRT